MNRNKWQGIACLLLASLMVGSTFAAPMRNENPTPKPTAPTQTAVPTTTPRPTTAPSVPSQTPVPTTTPKPTMAPSAPVPPSTKPSQTSKPCAPKPTTPPGTIAPQAPTCPSCPAPKPCPPCPPCPEQKPCPAPKPCPAQKPESTQKPCPTTGTTPQPSQTTKPCAPVKPDKNKLDAVKPDKGKVEQNKEQKLDKNKKECKQNSGTKDQKPFMLDHFKMIVVTLKKMGIEEKQIVTYIKEGKKLEDILKAENIKPKKFKKCIIKEYNKTIDEAQKSGQITCEQAKQLRAAVKETIKNWLPNK